MLSVLVVSQAKPKDRPYKLTDGQGLYLLVSKAGTRYWKANYTCDGKQLTRTYGQFPEVSLAQARQLHRAAHKQVSRAPVIDSVVPSTQTFREIAERWCNIKRESLKAKSKNRAQLVDRLEKHVLPHIGDRPVGELTRRELIAVIDGIVRQRKIETAHRMAGRIANILDFAIDIGEIKMHEGARLSRVIPAGPPVQHRACVPIDEIPKLLADIESYGEPLSRLALQMAALSFVRVGELRTMRWEDVKEDAGNNVWIIPAEIMKMGLPHVVPLSTGIKKVLAEAKRYRVGSLVFPSAVNVDKPLSENTLLFALYRLGYRGRMTVHGFRTLASSVLNEQSPFKPDVIERQLAHNETNMVRAAYNRAEYLPERREMMQWWSDWLGRQQV